LPQKKKKKKLEKKEGRRDCLTISLEIHINLGLGLSKEVTTYFSTWLEKLPDFEKENEFSRANTSFSTVLPIVLK
jgi:hypothetical protein